MPWHRPQRSVSGGLNHVCPGPAQFEGWTFSLEKWSHAPVLQIWMLDAVLSKGLTGSALAAQLSAVGPSAPGWTLWLPWAGQVSEEY